MLHIRPVTVERVICTCDRCGKEMDENSTDCEYQERLTISFRAGYGSVFGDGNLVEADFCQQCIHDVFGKYLTITADHPFRPGKKPESTHWRAFQQYQCTKS